MTKCPFAVPNLSWREVAFSPSDGVALHYTGDPSGDVVLALPNDLHRAVPKRRAEFLAGRLCAALALRALEQPEFVGRNDRAPVWPMGIVGSITHHDTRAIAAVSHQFSALGVDLERLMTQSQASQTHALILDDAERARRPHDLTFETYLTLAFSAKEALYKALAPGLVDMPAFLDMTVNRLDHREMTLSFNGQSHRVQYILRAAECLTLAALA